MARSPFTPTTTVATGVVLASAVAVDSGNGNEWTNTGRSLIEIFNNSASAITATFITQGTYSVGTQAYAINDNAVTVAASATQAAGPFDTALYNSTTSTVQVNWSSGTGITARVIVLGTS
jgi:hypothetical protein